MKRKEVAKGRQHQGNLNRQYSHSKIIFHSSFPLRTMSTTRSTGLEALNADEDISSNEKLFASVISQSIPDAQNSNNVVEKSDKKRSNSSENTDEDGAGSKKQKKIRRSTREYVPKYRSGAYAILLALLHGKRKGKEFMLKTELAEAAQPFTDEPIVDSGYDGWSCMNKTLVAKEMVMKEGKKNAKFSLSDKGFALAEKLVKKHAANKKNDEKDID